MVTPRGWEKGAVGDCCSMESEKNSHFSTVLLRKQGGLGPEVPGSPDGLSVPTLALSPWLIAPAHQILRTWCLKGSHQRKKLHSKTP